MKFITQGKTNWIYLLIVVIAAAIVGGVILNYQRWSPDKTEILKNVEESAAAPFTQEDFNKSLTALVNLDEVEIDMNSSSTNSGCHTMGSIKQKIKGGNQYALTEINYYDSSAKKICESKDLGPLFFYVETYWIEDKVYNRQDKNENIKEVSPDYEYTSMKPSQLWSNMDNVNLESIEIDGEIIKVKVNTSMGEEIIFIIDKESKKIVSFSSTYTVQNLNTFEEYSGVLKYKTSPIELPSLSASNIYKNEEYGFEIKFSEISNYAFRINNRDTKNTENNSKNIQFNYEAKEGTLAMLKSLYVQEMTSDVKKKIVEKSSSWGLINIAGYEATAYYGLIGYDLGELGDSQATIVIVFNRNPYFFVRVSPDLDFFESMLSTFKFIEKDETANRQIYTNKVYGFEFKYPDNFIQDETTNAPFEQDEISYNYHLPNLSSITTFNLNGDKYKNTGFQFAYFSIGVDINPSDVSICQNSLPSFSVTSMNQKTAIDIDGKKFYRFKIYDDAMGGQRGTGYVYFGVYDEKCFVLHGFLAFHDSRGFVDAEDNPIYLTDSDANEILNNFEQVFSTFKFIE